jgi:probable phosphoglycerate mutase
MTQMLLVRHGQSEWNALGRWQGRADPALTDLGRQQAFHAAGRIGSVDVICASPLVRALDTARIISEQLGVGPVVVESDLAERDAGEWQGLTRAEIEQGWPGYLATDRRPPGYEPHDALVVRARGALDRIEAEYRGAEVLVVTHGGLIGAVERDAGLPWERMPNLGGRWVTHHGDHLVVGDRLVLVDDDELTVPTQI